MRRKRVFVEDDPASNDPGCLMNSPKQMSSVSRCHCRAPSNREPSCRKLRNSAFSGIGNAEDRSKSHKLHSCCIRSPFVEKTSCGTLLKFRFEERSGLSRGNSRQETHITRFIPVRTFEVFAAILFEFPGVVIVAGVVIVVTVGVRLLWSPTSPLRN